MPQPGSPASDAGNPGVAGSGGLACEATDQRGVARPVGPGCDIGAFEGLQTGTTNTTTSTTTTTTTTSTTTTTLCGPAPHAGCQPALGQKSKLTLKNLADDTKDRLSWSWTTTDPVFHGELRLSRGGADQLCGLSLRPGRPEARREGARRWDVWDETLLEAYRIFRSSSIPTSYSTRTAC